ncbi:MAG: glycosyltransferase family 39 protein [Candidatus Pacearchaeota archaeon]|nr:glycosyltransferase family 39 protein [Candidatus Pacearchaeota archaeon]
MDKKEKVKNWLKNPYNLTFLGILLVAIIIRMYFFILTKNQPLWWDEADYLAFAKNLSGFNVDWIVTAKHNSLYPFFAAVLFKFGFSEIFSKFILQIIPSILSVWLVYLIANEMYKDKRVGLIASFILSIFWVHLFNSTRFHIDIPALFTGLLAIFVFWRGYENKKKIFGKINPKWAIPITAFLVVLTYSIRRAHFIFGLFFLLYIILTKDWKNIIKDRHNWIGLGLVIVLLIITENFIFSSGVSSLSEGYFHTENPITFAPFKVFSAFFSNIFNPATSILLYLFWAGFLLIIVTLSLSVGHIKKSENKETRADLFNFLAIILTLSLFIFILRTPDTFGEPRWYLPLAFSSLIFIGKISSWIIDKFPRDYKKLAVILIAFLIAFGGYYEIKHSNEIIKNKLTTYNGIKEASLFIKQISDQDDIIITRGMPQVAYYSERNAVNIQDWASPGGIGLATLDDNLNKIRQTPEAKYLIITFSEPGYPEWARNANPQTSWEIPFMATKIDLRTQEQDIKQEASFEDITFKLIEIKEEVFIYKIIH